MNELATNKPMPNHTEFGSLLAESRRTRGYATAYAFFHKNGGTKHMGFTYNYYVMIESGRRLPSVPNLKQILETLLPGGGYLRERQQLLMAYVRALASDAMFDPVFASLQDPKPAPERIEPQEDRPIRELVERKGFAMPRMSVEQFKVMRSSRAAFWTFQWLLESGVAETPAALSLRTGFPEASISEALFALEGQKLVRRLKNGEYYCPHFSTGLFDPPQDFDSNSWLGSEMVRMIKERRIEHAYQPMTLCCEDDGIVDHISAAMRDAVRRALLYRPHHPVRNGKLVMVESRVTRVL